LNYFDISLLTLLSCVVSCLAWLKGILTSCTGLSQYAAFNYSKWGWNSTEMHVLDSLGIVMLGTLFFTLVAVMPRRDPQYELAKRGDLYSGTNVATRLTSADQANPAGYGSSYMSSSYDKPVPSLGSAYHAGRQPTTG
jgi:hypothetical protein